MSVGKPICSKSFPYLNSFYWASYPSGSGFGPLQPQFLLPSNILRICGLHFFLLPLGMSILSTHASLWLLTQLNTLSYGGSDSKEPTCNAGDLGLIPGFRRSPRKRNGNPLQYSCLENPMDTGAWQSMESQNSDTTEQLTHFLKELDKSFLRVA